jgi:hypothetical protein
MMQLLRPTSNYSSNKKKRPKGPKYFVEVLERQLPEVSTIVGPLAAGKVTSEQRQIVYSYLHKYGASVIRKAIDIQNVTPTEAEETTSNTKKMKLAQTIGNGVAGEPPSYYTMTSNVPKIEDLVWDLVLGPGSHLPDKSYKNPPTTPRRKSILIKAGIGSEKICTSR